MTGTALWKAADVAELTGFAPFTIRRKARRGEIPAVQIAGRYYFRPKEIERWLASLPAASAANRVAR